MLLSTAEAWSSLDVVRRSSFASCCVFVANFPTVDVSRIWGPTEQSSCRWLDFQETLSWVLFSNSNLALKGGVLYHKYFFFMGSLSMHFIKCDQWPIVVCNCFVFSRWTFSFKCYYCWLRKNSSFTRIYSFGEEMRNLTTTYLLGLWPHDSGKRECTTGLLRF